MADTPVPPRATPRPSRARRAAFAATAATLSAAAAAALLIAADVYLHWKYERTAAVNVWGYRGPVVDRKAAGETRVVVLGGSAAFGYGGHWNEAFPYFLEERLNARGEGRFSVVNLAFNNESAHSFRPTLEDYRYLDYDVAILYEGYNDLLERTREDSFRRESAVFRLTGYLPILPMVLREKALALTHDGDVNRGYHPDSAYPVVFSPRLADRAAASALEAAADTVQALERQLGRLTRTPEDRAQAFDEDGCGERWLRYCDAVHEAVDFARRNGSLVVVGTQPYISDLHVSQQSALKLMVQREFGHDPCVRHADMGEAIDLRDGALAYDGMHLTAEGNRRLADLFVAPVLRVLGDCEG